MKGMCKVKVGETTQNTVGLRGHRRGKTGAGGRLREVPGSQRWQGHKSQAAEGVGGGGELSSSSLTWPWG